MTDKRKTICIDPGHGGKDPGAVDHSLHEEDFNLIISSLVSAMLRQNGFNVFQTRAFDEHLGETKIEDLNRRCEIANKNACNLFVSIHANAADRDKAKGFEVLYSSQNGMKAAVHVLDSFKEFFPENQSRGLKQRTRIYVLKHTRMPAILIEGGFLTNPSEVEFLKDEKKQIRLATAITNGIESYFRKVET